MVYEYRCQVCGGEQERYVPHFNSPNPPCEDPACDGETEKLISNFAIIFTGEISGKYNDRSIEGGDHRTGAHWATSLRTPDGKPHSEYIETFQQQREFCKREGLVCPTELPSNAEAVSDRRLSEKGMPGQWA